ncbi:MAG: cytochrome c biogenesis protein CcsA, partial [Cyclobacteriaceae bacterium]|nr:cytochrome c biogenesis protein CcsA [Cyclobacteriaceae bacterium]
WVSGFATGHNHEQPDFSIATNFFESYRTALNDALVSKDYSLANKLVNELAAYQKREGASVIPGDSRIRAEILLNSLHIFNRLAVVYVVLGLSLLFFLFYTVFSHRSILSTIYKILFGLMVAGFVLHTLGLGLRWYVSERAPWSNGYESMIYIAWTTVLAGLLFARKSFGGLAATMVLSATVLLVANLSDLDPEITPLVPVLRSYWLTIHVSLEAGSYGFLMLGALIGIINLILMIFITPRNKENIYLQIKEMTYLSEMTLIGGLFMISVGTYLGGVWANESWGRYWGWDAKETWALVTILVYAFILHMRLIPKLQSLFAYNFASIFGLASVIMTYYGVNYYLSGLHSYAAGDPVPIPQWVYIVIGCIIIISLLAYLKKRKYSIS